MSKRKREKTWLLATLGGLLAVISAIVIWQTHDLIVPWWGVAMVAVPWAGSDVVLRMKQRTLGAERRCIDWWSVPHYFAGSYSGSGPLRRYAYEVPVNPSPRLSGLPEWRETYDIEARAPANAVPSGLQESEKRRRMQGMIRRLLADHFKLVMRVEQKTMTVYALTVANGGPKLQKSAVAEKDCIFDTDQRGCHTRMLPGRRKEAPKRALQGFHVLEDLICVRGGIAGRQALPR